MASPQTWAGPSTQSCAGWVARSRSARSPPGTRPTRSRSTPDGTPWKRSRAEVHDVWAGMRTGRVPSPLGAPGSGLDEDFEALAVVHVLVTGRHTVDVGGGVENLSGLDAAVEDVGHELLDVGTHRGGPTGESDVRPEEAAEADGGVLVLRDTDAADHAAGADDAEGLLVGGHVADGLEDGVHPVAAGELAVLRYAFLPASGNDVGGAEFAAQVSACRVTAHQDNLLRAEALGR